MARDLRLMETSARYVDDGEPIVRLPGWLSADATTQRRILDAARGLLFTFSPSLRTSLGSPVSGLVGAAYEALVFLADVDRKFLFDQDAAFWSKWLPLLLWYPFDRDDSGNCAHCLGRGKARLDLPNAVLLLTRGDQHNVSRCIMKCRSIWASDIEDILASAVARDGLSAEWTRGAIEELVSHKNKPVIQLLVLRQRIAMGRRLSNVPTADILMRYVPERVWAIAWPCMTNGDEKFGRKLMESLACARKSNFFSFVEREINCGPVHLECVAVPAVRRSNT